MHVANIGGMICSYVEHWGFATEIHDGPDLRYLLQPIVSGWMNGEKGF